MAYLLETSQMTMLGRTDHPQQAGKEVLVIHYFENTKESQQNENRSEGGMES